MESEVYLGPGGAPETLGQYLVRMRNRLRDPRLPGTRPPSMRQLALLAELDPTQVGRWEQDKAKPTAALLRKYARALRVSEAELLARAGYGPGASCALSEAQVMALAAQVGGLGAAIDHEEHQVLKLFRTVLERTPRVRPIVRESVLNLLEAELVGAR